jgi:hypothetical protein
MADQSVPDSVTRSKSVPCGSVVDQWLNTKEVAACELTITDITQDSCSLDVVIVRNPGTPNETTTAIRTFPPAPSSPTPSPYPSGPHKIVMGAGPDTGKMLRLQAQSAQGTQTSCSASYAFKWSS